MSNRRKKSEYSVFLQFVEEHTTLKEESSYSKCGPCPNCGGNDRFYFKFADNEPIRCQCRHCKRFALNVESFCRFFLGMSRSEAEQVDRKSGCKTLSPTVISEESEHIDRNKWQAQAAIIVHQWHENLLNSPKLLSWLKQERGIERQTVERFKLGFCIDDTYWSPADWGITQSDKHVYASKGLSIPYLQFDQTITGIKIRKFKPTDGVYESVYHPRQFPIPLPKPAYICVRGTKSDPWVLNGDPCCFTHGEFDEPCTHIDDYEMNSRPVVIVESELDALVLWQHANQYITPVAILSANAQPSLDKLPSGPILYALDHDDAGIKPFKVYWKKKCNAYPSPPLKGKDISDMVRSGIHVLDWLSLSLKKNGLLEPHILNPYTHYILLKRYHDLLQKPLAYPDHIQREFATGLIHWWHLECRNLARRRQMEREYLKLWGLTPKHQI